MRHMLLFPVTSQLPMQQFSPRFIPLLSHCGTYSANFQDAIYGPDGVFVYDLLPVLDLTLFRKNHRRLRPILEISSHSSCKDSTSTPNKAYIPQPKSRHIPLCLHGTQEEVHGRLLRVRLDFINIHRPKTMGMQIDFLGTTYTNTFLEQPRTTANIDLKSRKQARPTANIDLKSRNQKMQSLSFWQACL